MLTLETLYRKPAYKKADGNYVLDLIKASLRYLFAPEYQSTIIVTDDFQMRPDLISGATTGDPSKMDYILKINGISNPLSIESGDVLVIPDIQQMSENFFTPDAETDEKKNILQSNKNKPKLLKDKLREELLKKQKEKSSEPLLPPNIKSKDAKNIKFKDGKIIFGDDVTNYNKEDCPVVLTRARVKERLLNKKIFS